MEDRLRRVFQQSFGVAEIEDGSAIGSVKGWDSLGHVGLMLALQHEFGVRIPPARAVELVTVKDIKAFLQEQKDGQGIPINGDARWDM